MTTDHPTPTETPRPRKAPPTDVLVQFRQLYARLTGLPEDAPLVQQLARAARGLADPGKLVLTHGHGVVELEFHHSRYTRPTVRLPGPEDRE